MTNAILAHPLDPSCHADPSAFSQFFTEKEQQDLRSFLRREHPASCHPYEACSDNFFLGFFFDGTRNNYALSEERKDFSHSNVARLFDAYPGQTIAPRALLRFDVRFPEEARYPHFFRIYIPGVGTPFEEIGDSGQGMDSTLGSAAGRWGTRRLVWALVQALNAVHRYFHRRVLFTPFEIQQLARRLDLSPEALREEPREWPVGREGIRTQRNTTAELRALLQRFHESIRHHIPDAKTGRPARYDPGIVKGLYVSAVGFSRGAAAARSFANGFVRLCALDARLLGRSGLTLGGFPVTFDFLGLFDTVASVGLAESTVIGDGHADWAHNDLLRIPPEVRRAVHLVAAHEVRRSFPLDSISWARRLPANGVEIVFPGVHSDVGGGYRPGEQGRGEDPEGTDLLSRIPLAVMYREARLAGMPLKLEKASPLRQKGFRISPRLMAAFNAYLSACPTREGTLTRIMREQMRLAIHWRRLRVGQMEHLASTRRAAQADRNDLLSAQAEFVEELETFDRWRREQRETSLLTSELLNGARRLSLGLERWEEWELLARDWKDPPPPLHPAIVQLFDDYVHDSRAWFKVSGPEAEEWEAYLRQLDQRFRAYERVLQNDPRYRTPEARQQELARQGESWAWVQAYRKAGYKVPPMVTHGREPFGLGAGYLRLRRIYSGPDDVLLTGTPPSEQFAHSEHSEASTARV